MSSVAFAQCNDLSGVTAIAQELLQQSPQLGSSCISIEQHGVSAYQQCVGTFTTQQVVPIASATKTLSAAVLLSLVDDGLLSLDDRVGQYLPEWNSGQKAQITLRMCFAHTAGIVRQHPAISNGQITLRQAAVQVALTPLAATPGTAFAYGGVSMHVAGAVCEVASGLPWAQLFAARVAAPLGMLDTDYYAFAQTANPRIAGGARSSLADFAAFVGMLRAGGLWNGTQVLSQAAVDTMLLSQAAGATIVATPHPNAAGYGVGIWLDQQDSQGRTLLASAVGAFGFAGWIDRAHDASGVFLVFFSNQTTYPFLQRVWHETDAVLLPVGVDCLGISTPTCADATRLNGTQPARAGNLDFGLLITRAPANSLGGLVLGDPAPGGLGVFDLTAFVGPGIEIVATLVADGNGVATVPAPLAAGLLGATFALQSVWLSGHACTSVGLQASHAIKVTVLP